MLSVPLVALGTLGAVRLVRYGVRSGLLSVARCGKVRSRRSRSEYSVRSGLSDVVAVAKVARSGPDFGGVARSRESDGSRASGIESARRDHFGEGPLRWSLRELKVVVVLRELKVLAGGAS